MKFVILDVYPKKNHRLIKDTAGGYGTGNNFGKNFFSKLLNVYVDNNIGMPAIEIMYISSILKKNNEVYYTRDLKDQNINTADYIILPSSIIAHETEINTLEQLIVTLPALWICGQYFSANVAAILGLVFFFSRILYAIKYNTDPKSRGIGFAVGLLANIGLIFCALYGILT